MSKIELSHALLSATRRYTLVTQGDCGGIKLFAGRMACCSFYQKKALGEKFKVAYYSGCVGSFDGVMERNPFTPFS